MHGVTLILFVFTYYFKNMGGSWFVDRPISQETLDQLLPEVRSMIDDIEKSLGGEIMESFKAYVAHTEPLTIDELARQNFDEGLDNISARIERVHTITEQAGIAIRAFTFRGLLSEGQVRAFAGTGQFYDLLANQVLVEAEKISVLSMRQVSIEDVLRTKKVGSWSDR
ncbi:hypothetical protein KC640_01515 [Candidatus Dojkabacteria bacterium]|uniref:Uncharacterized protein n=1 Tax=Candidatus Dojkabacteria bacterium TaxID=2099670 RepID=A0A955KYS7_9BACT|nr:hypothetical protein [Candidatus Dojkabacteria bacterium]